MSPRHDSQPKSTLIHRNSLFGALCEGSEKFRWVKVFAQPRIKKKQLFYHLHLMTANSNGMLGRHRTFYIDFIRTLHIGKGFYNLTNTPSLQKQLANISNNSKSKLLFWSVDFEFRFYILTTIFSISNEIHRFLMNRTFN